MSVTRYAISWIYGEFQVARIKQGEIITSWQAPYIVRDLSTLAKAMTEASEHIDFIHGGDVAIAYEDDLHTHEFFDLPKMAKKDLQKLLIRKVEKNKPFKEDAAWCYHEAIHSENEQGILLHLLPQDIVDAIVRICQEFYLTPRRLVPLTEVVSELIPDYSQTGSEIVIVAALFSERTEIITSLSNGEILCVRELPYSGYTDDKQRLVTDINRTLSYAKQQFKQEIDCVWLIGKDTDQIQLEISGDVEAKLQHDPASLDTTFWAAEVAKLSGQLSANFIPLFASKRINRTLFSRVALWVIAVSIVTSLAVSSHVENVIATQYINKQVIEYEIHTTNVEITKFEELKQQRDMDKQKLKLLQANAHNLPALFINHLGQMVPDGLILLRSEVLLLDGEWKITLQGESEQSLSEIVNVMQTLETTLEQEPWNITISRSWKSHWYEQLKTGSASSNGKTGFEIIGWMQ